jgi:hypothetical protein
MKQLTLFDTGHQRNKSTSISTFFPLIIREFEDNDDEPMIYGDNY